MKKSLAIALLFSLSGLTKAQSGMESISGSGQTTICLKDPGSKEPEQ